MEGDQRGAEKRKEAEQRKGEEMMEKEMRRQEETLTFNEPLNCPILHSSRSHKDVYYIYTHVLHI